MRGTALALLFAAVLFVAVGFSSVVSISRQSADAVRVEHSHRVLEALEVLLRLAIDARRSATAYVATGDPYRLQTFERARRDEELALASAGAMTAGDPHQQASLRTVRTLIERESADEGRIISLRMRDAGAAAAALRETAWVAKFEHLQAAVEGMKAEEQHILAASNAAARSSVWRAKVVVITGDVIAFALTIFGLASTARQARRRREADARVAQTTSELTERVTDLQRRSTELSLLTRLGEMLQTCERTEESAAIMRQSLPHLFPGARGAVFTIAPSRNLVVPLAAWGGDAEPAAFAPPDCWALRRGAIHEVAPAGVNVTCRHMAGASATLCIPMMAHGEALGLLSLEWPGAAAPESRGLAVAVAEQVGLAQANLGLQETLRRQAMRDPLTGLFNRRYMEETLTREIHRASRQQASVSLLLLDLDHFKTYNDTFGHFAGDDLLRSAAAIMQRAVRADDVVCRYGGDEFVIIMPEADANSVDERAQALRSQLGQLPRSGEGGLGVTVSIGIAEFPAAAGGPKELLLAADAAMYEAKRGGRDRSVRALPLSVQDAAASDR